MTTPQDIELEKLILGILINNPSKIANASSRIKANAFYKEQNKLIYECLKSMHDNDQPIDLVLLTIQLKKIDLLDNIGGAYYISELSSTSTALDEINIDTYCLELHSLYLRREIIRIGQLSVNEASDLSKNLNDVYEKLRDTIEDVPSITQKQNHSSYDAVKRALVEIEEDCALVAKGLTSGIPTPLSELNSATGGLRAPMFTVLPARPGVGKTTVSLNIAIHAAQNGYNVSFYSYEMNVSTIIKIILARQSGVNRSRLRDGRLDDNDWKNLNSVVDEIANLKINWYDNPDITASQIRANTYKEKKEGKCDLVIVDYLQLIPASEKVPREQEVSANSRTLKKITTGIGVPVIALAQLNRDIEKRTDSRPKLSDIRESGAIEQDADLIAFLYNVTDIEGQILERRMNIAKWRNGRLGDFQFYMDDQMTRMYDHPPMADFDYSPYDSGFESRDLNGF